MKMGAQLVAARVAAVLYGDVTEVVRLPASWGNETWRTELAGGENFVVKLGPAESARKWSAATVGYQLASAAGLPTSRVVHCDEQPGVDGRVMRIFTWLEGDDPRGLSGSARARFFSELGASARSLHAIELARFSSRLDGSAPEFERWDDYVAYRLPAVIDRASKTRVLADMQLGRIETEIRDLAEEVSDGVRPVLCHRDLHLGNTLATSSGALSALLDFDGAEAWDPAADFVKLRWQTCADPDDAAAFNTAYLAGGSWPTKWDYRLRLADLLELTNNLANARVDGHADYEERTRRRLQSVLDP